MRKKLLLTLTAIFQEMRFSERYF